MRLRLLLFIFLPLLTTAIYSCKKDQENESRLFYGKWKTSYGDTIEFTQENGKNILLYDESLNPSVPVTTKREFRYINNKLAIKFQGYPSPGEYKIFESFTWIQLSQSFSIQGIEWFPFISSTQTYFTFTKIP